MRINHFGHSCLHVVDGDASVLIDPGNFSDGYQGLTGLTAVLITHQHPDHLDPDTVPALIAANPQAAVYADPQGVTVLAGLGVAATAVTAGDVLDAGTRVEVFGGQHAIIHQDIPQVTNVAYLVGGRLLHPGDSYAQTGGPVEILAVPTSAPWMAIKESIDYVRQVAPGRAFPIHAGTLSDGGRAISYRLLGGLKPDATDWTVLEAGSSLDL